MGRLQFLTTTVRQLYVWSGNQCAFPGCTVPVIDDEGTLCTQIAHIEGAEEGSERFNPKMSDEERRAAANLLILCYPHHNKTNDVEKYPRESLWEIKRAHEAKHKANWQDLEAGEKTATAIKKLETQSLNLIQDLTKFDEPKFSASCKLLNQVLGWKQDEAETAPEVSDLNLLAKRLQKLPRRARSLLALIFERSELRSKSKFEASYIEIREVAGISHQDMAEQIHLLAKHEFVGQEEDFDGTPLLSINQRNMNWPMFEALYKFSRKTGIEASDLITNLNFKLLD